MEVIRIGIGPLVLGLPSLDGLCKINILIFVLCVISVLIIVLQCLYCMIIDY